MFKKYSVNLIVLCALASISISSHAKEWEAKFYNPKPMVDDVILPMPCDGKMAFRTVNTATKSALDDVAIVLGNESAVDGFSEHATPNYISGSFSDKKVERYFLMAKYEITQLQYDAVMHNNCQVPTMKLRQPMVNISWFDAMEFSNKYTQWLLKSHIKQLPTNDGIPGFIRLPTNTEWEYAARGGMHVSQSEFRDRLFPMPSGKATDYMWFSSSQSANGRLQLTGLLEPNPLGLHDILGNASEMMFDAFQLNKLDRYHGQKGAVTIRGGSYLNPENAITTSTKIEKPYYSVNQTGETEKAKDIGFRVVLTSQILTTNEMVKKLDQEWKHLGDTKVSDTDKTIVGQLDDITSQVENEQVKQQLIKLNGELKAANQSRDEQRDHAIRSVLQLGAFLCADVASLDLVYSNTKQINSLYSSCSKTDESGFCAAKDREKAYKKEQTDKAARDFVLRYYADTVVDVNLTYPLVTMEKQLAIVKSRLSKQGKSNLTDYLNIFWRHLSAYNKNGLIKQPIWLNDCNKDIKGN